MHHNPSCLAMCAVNIISALVYLFLKFRLLADMNELTFVLRYTTLTATKTDSEYKKLELPSVSIGSCESTEPVAMGIN